MLETAIGLLAAHGYSGMKLADVSRDSGYSYGLAPFYFESKAGLMLAIQEEIDATFTEYMASVCDRRAPAASSSTSGSPACSRSPRSTPPTGGPAW